MLFSLLGVLIGSYQVTGVFRLWREGEQERLDENKAIGNRKVAYLGVYVNCYVYSCFGTEPTLPQWLLSATAGCASCLTAEAELEKVAVCYQCIRIIEKLMHSNSKIWIHFNS